MRKHSKDVSKVASLLMSVAMVGGSVVPNIPVWATTDDDGDDGVTIEKSTDGTALGCAKVVADSTEGSYTVTLSKDTNVALRSKEEIDQENASTDGKGKDDESKNEVSKDGKSDSEAPAVDTSDVATLPLYGALGGVSSVLLGAAAFLKKKFRK